MKTLTNLNDYVFAVSPMSRDAIEAEATEILRRHSPRLLRDPGRFDALNFFEHILPAYYGLSTGVDTLSDGVEGQACPDGSVLVSEQTYSDACDGVGRARFTVVHECYHGIKHRNQIRRALLDRETPVLHRRSAIAPYRDPEWQADRFAAAVLMPARMVEKVTSGVRPQRITHIIASAFQVSDRAACIRARDILRTRVP